MPKIITPPWIAEHLGCHPNTVRLAAKQGDIPEPTMVGGTLCWVLEQLPEIEAGIASRASRGPNRNGAMTKAD